MPVINGMHIIDYPSIFDPERSRKITEEGQKQLRQVVEELRKIADEHNVTMVTAKSLIQKDS